MSSVVLLGLGAIFWHMRGHEKSIVIVTASYNNKDYYIRNLDSIFAQNYHNYRLIYVDDCSTDDTYTLVKNYIEQAGQIDRVTLIRTTTNKGGLKNIYDAVHMCNDDDIIVTCDGDDWFAHNDVLARINKEYANPETWMTYGQFVFFPTPKPGFCAQLPATAHKHNNYRHFNFVASHPRTFYAWLFKQIHAEDLMYGGEFFKVTWDQAMMYPMLEMAGAHAHFIPDVLYVYNQGNPLCDGRLRLQHVIACERYIKSKQPYARLNSSVPSLKLERIT